MIIASLNNENLENYKKSHSRFELAFSALKKLIDEKAEVGKYEVDGNNVFALVQEYETKPVADKKFEIHKDYIDIQYIVSGEEIMGSETLDKLVAIDDYKPDAQLFFMTNDYDKIKLEAGDFAIFFPNEPHAPGIAVNDAPSNVKKIIIKILA